MLESGVTNEVVEALTGESAHAAPAHIVEAIPDELAHRRVVGSPRTIYEELWHIAFWQEITLDWISGIETPYPAKMSDPFPTEEQMAAEPWDQLRRRFLGGAEKAALVASDPLRLAGSVRCPSRPGCPTRIMSVQDQLLSLAAHNSYHLGRIVLLRQMMDLWPPPSGGFRW
jgi:uncharacterized damage-inducible protein DinB